MRKDDILEYYDECTTEVSMCYSAIKSGFSDSYVDDLMRIRGYIQEPQRKLIEDMELGYMSINYSQDKDTYINGFYGLNPVNFYNHIAGNSPRAVKESFLVTTKGNFLLDNRFIIPVEDMQGNYVALIGYYPDQSKYITASTPFFSKEAMFFNFRHAYEMAYKDKNDPFYGTVVLVEGIFDCLSLTAIGIPAISTMGATVSPAKGELLKFFDKVLGVPDNDKVGKRSLDRNDKKHGWQVPSNTTMIDFRSTPLELGNGEQLKIKDMDNFVSYYPAESVKECLVQFKNSSKFIEILEI